MAKKIRRRNRLNLKCACPSTQRHPAPAGYQSRPEVTPAERPQPPGPDPDPIELRARGGQRERKEGRGASRGGRWTGVRSYEEQLR
ncbi:hypothetical protein LX32DRAFT_644134 [Colletotrichum zoysiae]|uniref:Uncharacterized protein n=1 Tax=Colletotrichum zoysiae TaxID=1216348 RepID=A0AAD9H7I2_9PEZI|nr:hypothetical protein LX32DRAFT_644134 [Colletotrichum zoysiae]